MYTHKIKTSNNPGIVQTKHCRLKLRLALAVRFGTHKTIEDGIHEGKALEFIPNVHYYEFVSWGKRTRDLCEIGVKVFSGLGVFLQRGIRNKDRVGRSTSTTRSTVHTLNKYIIHSARAQ